jgi:phosphopentomutase
MKMTKRVIVIVLDSCGVGELPDAEKYGDSGSNTIGNVANFAGGLRLPHLEALGLGNIIQIEGVSAVNSPLGSFGKMAQKSAGKDSIYGHWEMMGVILTRMLPTYPAGFPKDLITKFEALIGRKVLGNCPASGTTIIDELGAEHIRTGYPIVYTSADSVFQIAAHESIIPVKELYRISEIAREMLTGEHSVGRVIARPFIGTTGAFKRTSHRQDFALTPPNPTVLDHLRSAGFDVLGIGKIDDLFANQGISECVHVENNNDGINQIIKFMKGRQQGLIFANLGDFDTLYGHRNNPLGFAKALEEFDSKIPELKEAALPDDIVILTADHGCDPTTPGTDHSREYVPVVVLGDEIKHGVDLGVRPTFADIGKTVLDLLGVSAESMNGDSFANSIRE